MTGLLGESCSGRFWGLEVLGSPPQPHAHCHHVLSLSQVSDKGLYSCRVSNAAGEAMRAFSLTVQGKLGTSLRAPLWYRWQHMERPRMGSAVTAKVSVLLSV